MQRSLLMDVQCPYTGSRIELESVERESDGGIEFGIVRSEAGRFPIVSGVLRLLVDDLRPLIVDLVKRRRPADALRGALEIPALMRRRTLVDVLWRQAAQRWRRGAAARTRTPGKQRVYRLVTRADRSFAALAASARAERWSHWQIYRFSMPTFLPVYALAHLATGRRTILDFGCGLGHSSFVMSRLAPEARVICADYSFTSLYLAKRFLVPHAACLCLDGDYPLPFVDRSVECVFSTDALQYITPKIGLAREFQRVLSDDGVIALAHLHNQRSPRKAGEALTASGYEGLFAGMVRRLYPEEAIVAEYVADGRLDLGRRWSERELDDALAGLSLVAAKTESAFTARAGLLETYIDAMRHPRVNPAYRARPSRGGAGGAGGTLKLQRQVGAPYAVERTIDGCEVLPRRWQIEWEAAAPERRAPGQPDSRQLGASQTDGGSVEDSEAALRRLDAAQMRELVRRFLVIETPESYL